MRQDTRRSQQQDTLGSAPTDSDAFLLWSSQRTREEGTFELSRGRVTCIKFHAFKAHARVCVNVFGELARQLDDERFDVGLSGFAVRTPVGIRNPDVLVDRVSPDLSRLSTATPIFVAEVLSPSTVGTGFTEKLDEYTAIETLLAYLICSQDEPRAWLWSRQSDGSWPRLPTELSGRDGAIPLGGLGIELSMAAIFRGIPDAPTLD